jgi:integrase
VLALCLGLRRGELLGLRWEDIDLDSGTLEVVQTLQRVGGALRFARPRTEDSARTIPLPPLCIEALRERRRQQFTERADAWPEWRENGLVFATRIGTPIEPDNLRRRWGRIRTTAGLTGTRFHDMRHTCVSLLLHLSVAPDMVREIVGHSDLEVTMTIYAHTLARSQWPAGSGRAARNAGSAAAWSRLRRHGGMVPAAGRPQDARQLGTWQLSFQRAMLVMAANTPACLRVTLARRWR